MAHGLLQARSYSRRWVAESEWSFICIHSCSPSLTLPAELPLLSDQWRHNKYNALESSWNLPPLPQPSWSVEKLLSVKQIHIWLSCLDLYNEYRLFFKKSNGIYFTLINVIFAKNHGPWKPSVKTENTETDLSGGTLGSKQVWTFLEAAASIFI